MAYKFETTTVREPMPAARGAGGGRWEGLAGTIAKDDTLSEEEDAPRYEQSFWAMNVKAKTEPPRILLVGLRHGLPDADEDDFYTNKHFLDYEIVIVDPQGALIGRNHDYTPKILDDVLSQTRENALTFLRRYARTTQKLVGFVKEGGLAIVFLRPMPTLKYERSISYGSETVLVNLNKYLPWRENTTHRAHGSNIEFTSRGPIGQFWEATNGLWSYEAVYNDLPEGPNLAHVRSHPDEVVANSIVSKKRGLLIMAPVPRLENVPDGELFAQAVGNLHKVYQTEGPAPQLPGWASDYSLPGEAELRADISAANGEIEVLREQVGQHTEMLDALCLHKLLVTGHDSALEKAVDRVLTDLGLIVEPGPKGRVDRTAAYRDRKFAVEVQGVKRGAKEDHARALTIWVAEVAREDNKEPKGLLVANPYRETPLADRGGNNPWPGETIKICKRHGLCAMTGLQLLGLYLDAMADDTKREQLIESMFDTEGLFEGYDDWEQFLTPVESKASEKG